MATNPQGLKEIQAGAIKAPYSDPSKPANYGNTQYFDKGGKLPSNLSLVNGVPTAKDTSFAGPNDTIVQWPDGHHTVLMANGLSVDVPAAKPSAPKKKSSGGGGEAAGANEPTKVIGPKKPEDLLPAFSPPAINQFPNFYDPGAYKPVAGSTGAQGLSPDQTTPDMSGQRLLSRLLGVPWYASGLTLTPGQNGYGMPEGGNLKNNFVDPRVYGYIAPTLAPAYYHGARSTAK